MVTIFSKCIVVFSQTASYVFLKLFYVVGEIVLSCRNGFSFLFCPFVFAQIVYLLPKFILFLPYLWHLVSILTASYKCGKCGLVSAISSATYL